MSKLTKLLALALVLVMVFSIVACKKKDPTVDPTTTGETSANPETGAETKPGDDKPVVVPEGTMVYATSTFGRKFSPFFYTTAYDGEVVNMFTGYLLASDRGGAVIYNGIEGETVTYNGTDYTYYGMGNVEVVQNTDGTVDYKLTMRDDVTFSDGVKATIDDVIFGIYVLADPTYDGSSTIYALPIEGMAEYRAGMDSRGNVIFAAGNNGYTANDLYTEEQYNKFWDYYNNNAGADFAQEIIDYCMSKYVDSYASEIGSTPDEIRASTDLQVKFGMTMWGFEYEDGDTAADYWNKIVAGYEGDTATAESKESAGSDRRGLTIAALGAEFEAGVSTGESAPNITGIVRTGDYTLTVHMTEYDATAIYNMGFIVAPLHHYGDKDAYDYANNKFGFTKGDLSGVKAKTTEPLGCGPYIYQSFENGTVTFKANTEYFLGTPHIETVLFKESVDSDYVPGIEAGNFDIAVPSISDATLTAIKKANGDKDNGPIVGDTITTVLVDYRGYGYIGINADLVNVNGEPGSAASKALRKGYMTLLAVHRDTVINSYYGDRAAVIQYPISNTSWAAPQPADAGYKIAYSTDAEGKAIYTDGMTDEQKYEAALQAAIGYFKAAGYTFDEATGKFTNVPTYEILIPGQGEQDHPAYGVAIAASEQLESIGITLQVNDVVTSVWNSALEGNTASMWAAAWQASVDPDMTQVYHSDNAHGNGTNSNHYSVDDAALDKLIADGRSSADTENRKSIYKEAMEIILDWGCELPLYQRKDCTTFSTKRINIATIPQDMTPYWGWAAELESMEIAK